MSKAIDYLSLPDVTEIEDEVYINKRLGNFKVRAMTEKQWNSYRKRCMSKKARNETEFDGSKLNILIISEHVIQPNLNDATFLQKANCSTAADFIIKKFLPGEIAEISNKISILSGFDSEITKEDIEDAKN